MEKISVPKAYEGSGDDVKNVIAPAALEANPNYIRLGDTYVKTLFVFTYPRYLSAGWFDTIINLPNLLDISIFVHPEDTARMLKQLHRRTLQSISTRTVTIPRWPIRLPRSS